MSRPAQTLFLIAIGLMIAASGLSAAMSAPTAASGNSTAKALTITLYGSIASPAGWGWASTNISNPGPTLTVNQGDVITFHLFAEDSTPHQLIMDLNNNQGNDTGDQYSALFSSPTVATTFMFTASTAGTFNYFCGVHGYAAQHGSLVVQSTGGGGGGTSIDPTLIIGGLTIVVAIVAVAAAVIMRRRPKPPTQPPSQP